jgi:hypothetical protein
MFLLLLLGSGIFWTITYILIIRRGILDHTYGMPFVALCANISWEFIFSFIFPPNIIQLVVNIIWFCLDVIILVLLFRYGPDEFADLPKPVFYAAFGLALVSAFCAVLLITVAFNDAGTYSAFGQNLMMSVLFVTMLYRRRSLHGQSISIAICKLLGTALASLAFYLYTRISHHSVLLPFLYIAILVYDTIYVVMVYMQQQGMLWATNEPTTTPAQRKMPAQDKV